MLEGTHPQGGAGAAAAAPPARSERPVSGLPLLFFIFGCVALDWRFSNAEVNIGNLVFLFSCVATWIAAFATGGGRLQLRSWTLVDTVFLAYVLLIVASTYWSVASGETLSQAVFIGGMWATTIVLGRQPIERVISYVVHAAFIVAILSLAVTLFDPEAYQPRTGELRGVYFHQLRLGLFMAVALGLLGLAVLNGQARQILRGQLVLVLYLAVISLVCILAFARLYTFFAVVALVVTVLLPNDRRLRTLFLILIGALVTWLVLDQNSWLGSLGEQGVDLSLSGRTRIWERTMLLAQDRASWGYGFASFDARYFDWAWKGYRPPHPHNSYLQAYFENGMAGLALTLAVVVAHFRVGLRGSRPGRRKSYSLFLVLVAVLGALTGSVYAGKLTAFFALLMLFVSIDAVRSRRSGVTITA